MNPILLKPEAKNRCQVIVMGRNTGTMGAVDYHIHKSNLRATIHHALTALRESHDLIDQRIDNPTRVYDGGASADGEVLGTMIHGIFDNDGVRASLLARFRSRPPAALPLHERRNNEYNRLATAVQDQISTAQLDRIIGLPTCQGPLL